MTFKRDFLAVSIVLDVFEFSSSALCLQRIVTFKMSFHERVALLTHWLTRSFKLIQVTVFLSGGLNLGALGALWEVWCSAGPAPKSVQLKIKQGLPDVKMGEQES